MTNTTEAAYEYTGYGEITQTQGTLTQPHGYSGREWDAESGLYHYRTRAHDPALGLFTSLGISNLDFHNNLAQRRSNPRSLP